MGHSTRETFSDPVKKSPSPLEKWRLAAETKASAVLFGHFERHSKWLSVGHIPLVHPGNLT